MPSRLPSFARQVYVEKKEGTRHEVSPWKRPIFRMYITEGARLVANVQFFLSRGRGFVELSFCSTSPFFRRFFFTYVALPVAPTASVGITRLHKQSFSPSTDL